MAHRHPPAVVSGVEGYAPSRAVAAARTTVVRTVLNAGGTR